jgi:regulatory protein
LAFRRNRTSNKITAERGPEADERPARGKQQTRADELERSSAEQPGKRVMKAALAILAARSCSEGQLRDRLSRKGWAEASLIEICINRLKELGYVNDDLFAHSYANYRVNSKPVGRARLARELAFRKVPRDSIDGALDLVFEEVAEETLIDRAISRRIRSHGRPADRAAAKRMFDHLARLGFEYDLIARKLRALKAETENDWATAD